MTTPNTITPDDLAAHRKWRYGEEGGKRLERPCAVLRCAVLRCADLSGADLRGAEGGEKCVK